MSKNDEGKGSPKSSVLFGSKMRVLLVVFVLFIPLLLISHEVSLRHFQEVGCAVCHEMKEPVRKWKESGAAKNHNNCAGCHAEAGIRGWMEMNKNALVFLARHFQRDPDEPISIPEEPLFLEEGKEPGYWSLVPNHRCFQCHDAANHKPADQTKIHSKLVNSIISQPCKDCHNHEMRNGQKFYGKVIQEQEQAGRSSATTEDLHGSSRSS